MHEVNELFRLAVLIASVGGVAAMLGFVVARDARRSRRSPETPPVRRFPRSSGSGEPSTSSC